MSFKQLVIEFRLLKETVTTQQGTIEAQQIEIKRLSSLNDLSFPLISDIYKSHLFKAAACLIFWSLHHRVGHYVPPEIITLLDALVEVLMSKRQNRGDVELKEIELSKLGPRMENEMQILSDARSLRSGRFTLWHLYSQTPNNMIGGLDADTLACLCNEVSPDLGSFTV